MISSSESLKLFEKLFYKIIIDYINHIKLYNFKPTYIDLKTIDTTTKKIRKNIYYDMSTIESIYKSNQIIITDDCNSGNNIFIDILKLSNYFISVFLQ